MKTQCDLLARSQEDAFKDLLLWFPGRLLLHAFMILAASEVNPSVPAQPSSYGHTLNHRDRGFCTSTPAR
ncbi:hypothetical protein NHX12_009004 [Muraenolepis orangiensis]|uniref:Uncharacterized protein n=1 Tax=Muraenolepis orangiensis TaxID=630683 RepID=A0A9Q0I8K4_9TELE|nr:hypothetical protein NHX12_009004 [Muraenolepis orangiensis]